MDFGQQLQNMSNFFWKYTYKKLIAKMLDKIYSNFFSCAEVCKSFKSRQELSNEYFLAEIGFDTAENEPLEVCQKLANSQVKKLAYP